MTSDEVFVNPTVKQVIFQIRFPNLFFLESKIGDFQVKVMREFPKPRLILRKRFMFVDAAQDSDITNLTKDIQPDSSTKVWEFESEHGVLLQVSSDSLSLISKFHKSYKSPKSDLRFRDSIESVLARFNEVTSLPTVSRVGLRYIDECPILDLTNSSFSEWYNSSLPINRFPLDRSFNMHCNATISHGSISLIYQETLLRKEDKNILHLDFDGYSEIVDFSDLLATTDSIHGLIHDEYFTTMRPPALEYMRTPKEE